MNDNAVPAQIIKVSEGGSGERIEHFKAFEAGEPPVMSRQLGAVFNSQRGKVGVGNQLPATLPLYDERTQNTPMAIPGLSHLYLGLRQPLIDDLHRRFWPKGMFGRAGIRGNAKKS